ncbi:MAG: hypothetical protein ABEJ94_10125 [Halorientalis sp.]
MRKRVLATLLVAALVALAGCSGGLPGGEGTDTGERTDSGDRQALESTTATVSTFSYPAGATPSGIENLTTLLDEHEAALSGTNVTLEGNVTFSFMSERLGPRFTIAHEATSDETLTTVVSSSSDDTFQSYIGPDVQAYRVQGESGTEYGSVAGAVNASFAEGTPESFTGRSLLQAIVGSASYNATGVVTRNGTELVRYELTESTSVPDAVFSVGTDLNATFGQGADYQYESTLLIDSAGVIHEAHYTVTAGESGRLSSSFGIHVEFTDIGSTTVTKPDWTAQVES